MMLKFYLLLFKISQRIEWSIFWKCSTAIALEDLKRLKVKHGKCTFYGMNHFKLAKGGYMEIGDNFICQSGAWASIDTSIESKFQVENGGTLLIGNNVGISSTIIHVWNRIEIHDHVKIGAGCMIFDTNFHSTNPDIRKTVDDQKYAATAPVIIKENAFIGTRSIITKGVTIGKNSMVAAGSVVVKDIPDNQIWGGNPAVFIKNL